MRTFTPLEKSTSILRRSYLSSHRDNNGLVPPSTQTAGKLSSLTGFTKIISITIFGALIVSIPLYCLSQKNSAELIKEAKNYIKQDSKEKAVKMLDLAFRASDSAGDVGSLMEIGDLYIRIDKSLEDKAMKAWRQAGKWKCK